MHTENQKEKNKDTIGHNDSWHKLI